MKILAVTTNFGLGPSSKMVTILNEIAKRRDALIDFMGDGNCLDYVKTNAKAVKTFIERDTENIDKTTWNCISNEYDLVINVMNCHIQEIIDEKTIEVFIDSLSWMWDCPISGIEKANYYFVQNIFIDDLKIKNLKNVEVINPILEIEKSNMEKEKTNDILVNVSGVFTPYEGDDFGKEYLKFYLQVFERINLKNFDRVFFACNEEQISEFREFENGKFVLKHFSHADFLAKARTSKKVFTTPGLTFYLEAKSVNIAPFYLLPSNYSQALLLEKYVNLGEKGISLAMLENEYVISKEIEECLAVQIVRNILRKAWVYHHFQIVQGIIEYLEASVADVQRKEGSIIGNGANQLVTVLEREGLL